MYLYPLLLNGQKVGYCERSHTPAEFNINRYLKVGENKIAVQVSRWCDGSYLEDQVGWRMSGIYLDVYLYSKPEVSIADFFAYAGLDNTYTDGILNLSVKLNNTTGGSARRYSLKVKVNGKLSGNAHDLIKELPGLNKEHEITISRTIKNIELWSHENPCLYGFSVELLNPQGEVVDNLFTRIGFREIEAMIQRDKNHPSVIMWSYGNESGNGVNIVAMEERAKELDTNRPTQYHFSDDPKVADVTGGGVFHFGKKYFGSGRYRSCKELEELVKVGYPKPYSLPRIGYEMQGVRRYGSDGSVWARPGQFIYRQKRRGKTGIYSGKIDIQFVNYPVPQENGNKTDVRWA